MVALSISNSRKAIVCDIKNVKDISTSMCEVSVVGLDRLFLIPKWWLDITNKLVICLKGFKFKDKDLGSDYLAIPYNVLSYITSSRYVGNTNIINILSKTSTYDIMKILNMDYAINCGNIRRNKC